MPTPPRERRILVVDDSREQCDLYAFMLEPGATVITALSGKDGLELAESALPDVILLDIVMPELSGWDVCARLKANPATADIPIVILTGFDEANVPARAREAGATAVLMKPCPIERLMLTIEATLQRIVRLKPLSGPPEGGHYI